MGLIVSRLTNLIKHFKQNTIKNEDATIKKKEVWDHNPPPKTNWLKFGCIEFRNVFLKVGPDTPYCLKNVSFLIKPREKIGVVGDTSYLTQALFRLGTVEGCIFIDGVGTNTVSLKELRSKLSIIPQKSLLFSGTVRMNLDPLNEFNNRILWNALTEVSLGNVIKRLRGGLDSKVTENGSNFTPNQKRLMCLARILLRPSKILILDETNSEVDADTRDIIRRVVKRRFDSSTVLTMIHKPFDVDGCDKVLVLKSGEVVEFDRPLKLLKNKGVFYSMLQKCGKYTEVYK